MKIMIVKYQMFCLKLIQFLFLLHVSQCQRRIESGKPLNTDKPYVVYLIRSLVSTQYYEGWTCGGALVKSDFIVTSAACVTDVQHLYAIAGYRKYISDKKIHDDPCTKEKKKKVVLICTPKAYELKYEEITKWSYIDIAVVRVESPYDFNDISFEKICSYKPASILINNEEKYQSPGIDALVFGWGHKEKWRQTEDPTDFNEKELNFSPVLMEDKEECVKHYTDYPGMDAVINKYMICSIEPGNIDDEGEVIIKSPPTAKGCTIKETLRMGKCVRNPETSEEIVLIDSNRRTDELQMIDNGTISNIRFNASDNLTQYNDVYPKGATRRNGICQNDHGGPLVTWVGSHEVLIGVASVFKINEDFDCIGPYLYTSTQCNGAFLDCVVRFDENIKASERRAICGKPPEEKGFDIVTKHVSWINHPAGPADNEVNASIYGTSNEDYDEFSDLSFEVELNVESNKTSYEINTKVRKDKLNITTDINKPGTIYAKYVSDKSAMDVITSAIDLNNASGRLDIINNSIVNLVNNAIFRTNASITDPSDIKNTSTYKYSTSSTVSNLTNTVINIIQNVTFNVIKNIFIFPTNDTSPIKRKKYARPIKPESSSQPNNVSNTMENIFEENDQSATTTGKPVNVTDKRFASKVNEDDKASTSNSTDSVTTNSTDFVTTTSTNSVTTKSTDSITTNSTDSVTTNSTNSVTTNSTDSITTNSTDSVTTNSTNSVTTNSIDYVTTNSTDSVTTNSTDSVTTNSTNSVTINSTDSVTTNSTDSVTTNSTDSVTTNSTDSVTTNSIDSVTTNSTDSVTTNSADSITTNSTDSVPTNYTNSVTTNSTNSVTTNSTDSVTTNSTDYVSINANISLTPKQIYKREVNFLPSRKRFEEVKNTVSPKRPTRTVNMLPSSH